MQDRLFAFAGVIVHSHNMLCSGCNYRVLCRVVYTFLDSLGSIRLTFTEIRGNAS